MKVITLRRWLLGLLALIMLGIGGIFTAAQVQAHGKNVQVTCASLSLELGNYQHQEGKDNRVAVVVDDLTLVDTTFQTSYYQIWNWDQAVAHHWKVIVRAWDDPTGSKGWSFNQSGTTVPCTATETTTTPTTSTSTTSTTSTTTTTSSTTTPPTQTTPPTETTTSTTTTATTPPTSTTSATATQPPTKTTASTPPTTTHAVVPPKKTTSPPTMKLTQATGELPRTGMSAGIWAALIGGLFLVFTGTWLRFAARKPATVRKH